MFHGGHYSLEDSLSQFVGVCYGATHLGDLSHVTHMGCFISLRSSTWFVEVVTLV
jgi:hypothetical protein